MRSLMLGDRVRILRGYFRGFTGILTYAKDEPYGYSVYIEEKKDTVTCNRGDIEFCRESCETEFSLE